MEDPVVNARPSLGSILQSVNRSILYLILFLVVSGSLVLTKFRTIQVPAVPQDYTKDAYTLLRNVKQGETIIIDTAYTNSSRGENGGQMEAVLRMMMRQKAYFALYTIGEPQCIQVARGVIDKINKERQAVGQEPYLEWRDYVVVGVFPDSTTMLQTMGVSLREAWSSKKSKDETGKERSIFESPVLQNIRSISDFKAYVTIAASATMPIIVPRVGKKVPVITMITGVMFPEQFNYYKTGQVKGLVNGLVGTVEFEWLMEYGIDSEGVVGGKAAGTPIAASFKGEFPKERNFARGMDYYLAFCCALGLLIVAVAIGNVGMFMERRNKN